jgi:hypothetical protein
VFILPEFSTVQEAVWAERLDPMASPGFTDENRKPLSGAVVSPFGTPSEQLPEIGGRIELLTMTLLWEMKNCGLVLNA